MTTIVLNPHIKTCFPVLMHYLNTNLSNIQMFIFPMYGSLWPTLYYTRIVETDRAEIASTKCKRWDVGKWCKQGCRSLLSIRGDNSQFYPSFQHRGDEPRSRFCSGEQIK